MSSFKRKPFEPIPAEDLPREAPEELTRRLSGAVAGLPTTTAPAMSKETSPRTIEVQEEPETKLPASYPHSFKASPQMSRILQELTRDIGIRCWIARVLKEQGHAIPKADLTPKKPGRTF
jgi:hypothetical protein